MLEARDRVGGRVLNTEIGGEPNELGGQWVAPYQSAMHELLAELGLELFHSYREGDHVYVDAAGTAHRYHGDEAPLRRRRRAPTTRASRSSTRSRRSSIRTHPGSIPRGGARRPQLRAMARGGGRRHARARPPALLYGGRLHDEAGDDLLRPRRARHGRRCRQRRRTCSSPTSVCNSRVVGGTQLIPLRLAERLGDRVALGAAVRTVRWERGGVELEAGEIRVTAPRAIVAVPPNVAGLIRFEPALPAWRMRLHQALTQGDVIKVLAVYETPFWRAEGLAGEGFAPYQLVREVYDNTPPAGRPGVLCTFLAGERAQSAERLDAAGRRRLVLEGMASFFGPRALEPVDVIELDWSQEEWTRGAYAATFGVGGLSRYGPT